MYNWNLSKDKVVNVVLGQICDFDVWFHMKNCYRFLVTERLSMSLSRMGNKRGIYIVNRAPVRGKFTMKIANIPEVDYSHIWNSFFYSFFFLFKSRLKILLFTRYYIRWNTMYCTYRTFSFNPAVKYTYNQ